MALPSGTRLGPYEILGLIGTGGMGEVYRATDTNLARQVAIKILPATFAHDPERLARFEREAKTLAALNHPNIAQIYGFEKNRLMAVPLRLTVEGRAVEVGAPVALFPTRLASGASIGSAGGAAFNAQYAVAADGRFLMNVALDEAATSPITIVQNWVAGLKQ
ncbi:MAG: protein kinase domain-containing protein [Vicinamibacterales bacterium]